MFLLFNDFENWLKDTDRWDYNTEKDFKALQKMYDILFIISEICVEESKSHITSEDAIEEIRKELNKGF